MLLSITPVGNRNTSNNYLRFGGQKVTQLPQNDCVEFPAKYLPYLKEVEDKDKSLAKKIISFFKDKENVLTSKEKSQHLEELNSINRLLAKNVQEIIKEKILPYIKEPINVNIPFDRTLCKIIDENHLENIHKKLNSFRTFLFELNIGILGKFYSDYKFAIKDSDIDFRSTLWNATLLYQPNENTTFSNYTYSSFKTMLNNYCSATKLIPVSHHFLKKYRDTKAEILKNNKNLSEDILEEKVINTLAKKENISPSTITTWIEIANRPIESLDAKNPSNLPLKEILPDPNYKHPSQYIDKNVLKDLIFPAIEKHIREDKKKYKKPAKVIKILRLRYLEEKKFEEIAKILGNKDSHQYIQLVIRKVKHDILNTPYLINLLKELK